MQFSGLPFLFCFLPAMILIYLLTPKKMKNAALFLGSILFYAWGEKRLVFLFLLAILLNYLFGLWIGRCRESGKGNVLLWIAVAGDLGMLFYFKYADFFIGSLNRLFRTSVSLLKVALPLGISFYTFQMISYLADVYRGSVKPQRNLITFGTYVALFPQLIAGPIVRYAQLEDQLEHRTHSLEKVADGARRFVVGLGKKVLIANAMGEVCTRFRATGDASVLFYWMYAVAFMLQIYFDFSGYSDMAIGLGKLFGFELPENFDYPYISGSITEFWRRWHMSLGGWFRDYVYIPLGGNRKGQKRQFFNILIVWALTGLWHGASWNFVLWGIFFAILLIVEKLGFLQWLKKHPAAGHFYVLLFVLLGFVLFNAADFAQLGQDLAGMFGLLSIPPVSVEAVYVLRSYGILFVMGCVGATPLAKVLAEKICERRGLGWLEPAFLCGIFLLVTSYLVAGSFQPFLYFRF